MNVRIPATPAMLVAVAEAAERHYRRAKDATRLLEAIELKLSEQRKFVLWWDSQRQHGGARPGAGRKRNQDNGPVNLND